MAEKDNNNNGPSMPYEAIIVLCLVGAGALFLCIWAVGRHFSNEHDPEKPDNVGPDGYTQAQYMRIVRIRNQEDLQRKYGHLTGYRPQPKPMAISSVSSY